MVTCGIGSGRRFPHLLFFALFVRSQKRNMQQKRGRKVMKAAREHQVQANESFKDVRALTKPGPMCPGYKCAVSSEDGLAFG